MACCLNELLVAASASERQPEGAQSIVNETIAEARVAMGDIIPQDAKPLIVFERDLAGR